MSDDQPKVWVQVQIVFPMELGGQIITRQLEASLDQEIPPDYGVGIAAIVDKVADDALAAVRQ
jgi:hypothetical protein